LTYVRRELDDDETFCRSAPESDIREVAGMIRSYEETMEFEDAVRLVLETLPAKQEESGQQSQSPDDLEGLSEDELRSLACLPADCELTHAELVHAVQALQASFSPAHLSEDKRTVTADFFVNSPVERRVLSAKVEQFGSGIAGGALQGGEDAAIQESDLQMTPQLTEDSTVKQQEEASETLSPRSGEQPGARSGSPRAFFRHAWTRPRSADAEEQPAELPERLQVLEESVESVESVRLAADESVDPSRKDRLLARHNAFLETLAVEQEKYFQIMLA
jgi:hypothetical protein